jgi:hypothetical protein
VQLVSTELLVLHYSFLVYLLLFHSHYVLCIVCLSTFLFSQFLSFVLIKPTSNIYMYMHILPQSS